MDQHTPTGDSQGRVSAGTVTKVIAVTAAASLIVGIIVGPILAFHPAVAADPTAQAPEHTITVSGIGLVSVKPDVADVVVGVSVTKPTAKEARNQAATQMTAVVGAVKKLGIADKDIVTVGLNLNPVYDYNSGRSILTGYAFSNSVRVTVRDLSNLASVVDDAVTAGATIVSSISFRLEDPSAVEKQARDLAMKDARSKADALAAAANVSIKGVATIAETSYSPPQPVYYAQDKAMAAAAPSTPIQTGTTDVQIQVTVAYLI